MPNRSERETILERMQRRNFVIVNRKLMFFIPLIFWLLIILDVFKAHYVNQVLIFFNSFGYIISHPSFDCMGFYEKKCIISEMKMIVQFIVRANCFMIVLNHFNLVSFGFSDMAQVFGPSAELMLELWYHNVCSEESLSR